MYYLFNFEGYKIVIGLRSVIEQILPHTAKWLYVM